MYDDNTVLSFGKFKFWKLGDVPADYLINIYENNGYHNKELKEYIVTNIDRIKERSVIGIPYVPFICDKVTYPTESEARFRLKKISKSEQDNKKPVRVYECPLCSGWHLTSKENKKFANGKS